ncbi:MAG: c-type cytochrome [Gammaproteobacteria bacterium]|nr:c-type cytochrome [Gammaproteobacteria bacterium]
MNPRHSSFLASAALALLLPVAAADHNTPAALEARIAPEGRLNVVAPGADSASAAGAQTTQTAQAPQSAKAVYDQVCAVCHNAGIAGAPLTGDASAWQSRIDRGLAAMVANAINGFQGATGVMPAKGGNAALSDDAVAAAVEWMVEQSQ